MAPNVLPPFGHACKVGLLSIKLFIQHNISQSLCQCTVLEPGSKVDSFSPEELGESAVVLYCVNALKQAPIEQLSHPVVLWGIVSG